MEDKCMLTFNTTNEMNEFLVSYKEFAKKNFKARNQRYDDGSGNICFPIDCIINYGDGRKVLFSPETPTKPLKQLKKSRYVKTKDRIPGQIYNGVVWYPKFMMPTAEGHYKYVDKNGKCIEVKSEINDL